VERAERARAEADLVMLVLDASREPTGRERDAAREGKEAGRTMIVWNKIDLAPETVRPLAPAAPAVSAITGAGLDRLRSELRERLAGAPLAEDPVLTDARHASALATAVEALDRAGSAAECGLSDELVLEDLRAALHALGTITGEYTQEDLYDRIFSTFCIGK
jgi:tRNA modification GTPase